MAKNTAHPDEFYFNSLNHSPQLGVPGSYTGRAGTGQSYEARYKIWEHFKHPCSGKYSRNICIFGAGDLVRLGSAKQLFANKFHVDFQPAAYDCIEEWIFNRTRDDLEPGAKVIDTKPYAISIT